MTNKKAIRNSNSQPWSSKVLTFSWITHWCSSKGNAQNLLTVTWMHLKSSPSIFNIVKHILSSIFKKSEMPIAQNSSDDKLEKIEEKNTDNSRDGNNITLHSAVHEGHLDTVQRLLANGANVNACDHNGWTLLHDAVSEGNKDTVQRLLANEANVNACNKGGNTPLHYAACKGHLDIAQLLLANEANVNACDNDCDTPLHDAAYQGHLDIAQLLLANEANVNACDDDGYTPLHSAVSEGHLDIAQLLLANEANVNACDNDGDTPLHSAAYQGNKDIAQLLLANEANVNACNKGGDTPLHYAVSEGHLEIAQLLLANEANVNACNKGGDTPWSRVVSCNKDPMIHSFLACNPDMNFKTKSGMSILDLVKYNKNKDIENILTAKSAREDVQNQFDQTPVDNSKELFKVSKEVSKLEFLSSNQEEIMSKVAQDIKDLQRINDEIKKNKIIDRNAEMQDSLAKLCYDWVKSGDLDINNFSLGSNSCSNIQDELGNTLLHRAVHAGHLDIAQLLRSDKAEVEIDIQQNLLGADSDSE